MRKKFQKERDELLPKLERELRELRARAPPEDKRSPEEAEEINTLHERVRRIISKKDEIDYEMRYTELLREHRRECIEAHTRAVGKWVHQRKLHSMEIHERQRRSQHLWEYCISIEFVGAHVTDAVVNKGVIVVHMNTTLPQLSLILHDIKWESTISDDDDNNYSNNHYYPIVYNATILNPTMKHEARMRIANHLDNPDDPSSQNVQKLASFLEEGDDGNGDGEATKKRRRVTLPESAYDNANCYRIKTSIGEALRYGLDPNTWIETSITYVIPIYIWPQTGSMWRVCPGKSSMMRIDDYVETLDQTFRQYDKRLYHKYMLMLGKPLPKNSTAAALVTPPKDAVDSGRSKCCSALMLFDPKSFSDICRDCGASYDSEEVTRNRIGHDHWCQCSHTTYKRMCVVVIRSFVGSFDP